MLKKFLPALLLPLLVGCNATFTNLTPRQQPRNDNHLYPVEVAFTSRQQSLRWDSIHPQVVVGNEYYTLRPVQLMTNRFEGLLPVPPDAKTVHYHYKFDFKYNAMGPARSDSASSPEYTLKIVQ